MSKTETAVAKSPINTVEKSGNSLKNSKAWLRTQTWEDQEIGLFWGYQINSQRFLSKGQSLSDMNPGFECLGLIFYFKAEEKQW